MTEVLAENFLHDLVHYLREQTKEPLVEKAGEYQRGYQFGLFAVMDHIKNRRRRVRKLIKMLFGFGDFDPWKAVVHALPRYFMLKRCATVAQEQQRGGDVGAAWTCRCSACHSSVQIPKPT